MENDKWYQVLKSFIKQYRNLFIIFILFVCIFAAVFSLYNLEIEAVLYAAGLCLLLSVIVLALRFSSYMKKHRKMQRIIKNINVFVDDLPEPKTLCEADLQEMIIKQKQLFDSTVTDWQTKWNDSLDYYITWAHQIKTPISVMRMMLQSEDTEEHRELSAELFRVEQYVEMVLSYMRLGSEFSDYVFKEYDLDTIIRQAIHKFASQFVRRKIRLDYTPVSVKVVTDEKWLLFIIEQILSNCIKYTRKGAVTITVTPEKVLKIADTGIGIAPEDLPRIFEKGFTGYNGRSDKKSTGLGLYLCKTAADRLSHKISAESEPGKGTIISIDLSSVNLEVE